MTNRETVGSRVARTVEQWTSSSCSALPATPCAMRSLASSRSNTGTYRLTTVARPRKVQSSACPKFTTTFCGHLSLTFWISTENYSITSAAIVYKALVWNPAHADM